MLFVVEEVALLLTHALVHDLFFLHRLPVEVVHRPEPCTLLQLFESDFLIVAELRSATSEYRIRL